MNFPFGPRTFPSSVRYFGRDRSGVKFVMTFSLGLSWTIATDGWVVYRIIRHLLSVLVGVVAPVGQEFRIILRHGVDRERSRHDVRDLSESGGVDMTDDALEGLEGAAFVHVLDVAGERLLEGLDLLLAELLGTVGRQAVDHVSEHLHRDGHAGSLDQGVLGDVQGNIKDAVLIGMEMAVFDLVVDGVRILVVFKERGDRSEGAVALLVVEDELETACVVVGDLSELRMGFQEGFPHVAENHQEAKTSGGLFHGRDMGRRKRSHKGFLLVL